MCAERYLASRIFEQAVSDYRELKTKGRAEIKSGYRGNYSIKEIETFFQSSWCAVLLDLMGINITGSDIPMIINQSLEVT